MKIRLKQIIIVFAAILSAVCAVSCQTTPYNNDKTIIDLIKHFDSSGVKAEKIYPVISEIIKADDGCVLIFEGQKFELYKYNVKNPLQKAKLDKVIEDGEVFVLGFKHSAKVNGSFVLLNYRGHPREADIVTAFENFK